MGFAEHDLPGRYKFQSTGIFKEHKSNTLKEQLLGQSS